MSSAYTAVYARPPVANKATAKSDRIDTSILGAPELLNHSNLTRASVAAHASQTARLKSKCCPVEVLTIWRPVQPEHAYLVRFAIACCGAECGGNPGVRCPAERTSPSSTRGTVSFCARRSEFSRGRARATSARR